VREGGVPKEDDTIKALFSLQFLSLNRGKVVLKRENAKIRLWKEEYKSEEIVFDSAGSTEKVYDLSVPAQKQECIDDLYGEEKWRWIEGSQASGSLKDTPLTLIYKDAVDVNVLVEPVSLTVVKLEIKNPTGPNKGVTNDSDDYFFRGADEPNVKVYYDFLPTDVNASSVKLLIKEGGSTLRQISLSTTKGTNLLAEWNGKDVDGVYYDDNKWDFRAVIEAVIGGETFTSNEHPIADLLYKHRPLVYVHDDELTGAQDVNCMMKHADLYKALPIGTQKVDSAPLDFNDLRYDANDSTDRWQDINNVKRQVNEEPNVIYCRGAIDSGYIFLQYWHFEPSSSKPEETSVYHEGDWEMFQIAVEPNTVAGELQPIAVTASQHYYGQTMRWDSNGFDNGPDSQNQDYVGKSGHQPKVYIALNSHATFFREGHFRHPGGGANHGYQYLPAPTGDEDDATGGESYSYTLRILHDNMISHWQGAWGHRKFGWPWEPDDGPPSPRYRYVKSSPKIYMWTDPRDFNNYYLKLKSYPDGALAHPDCNIP
jgi:hypothetical protein